MRRTLPLLLALAALATPACAQMRVDAPTPAAARTLTDWYAQHIPPRYRAALPLTVSELSSADMDTYLAQNNDHSNYGTDTDTTDIDGIFESSPDRLTLRIPADGPVDLFTFAHEYGHYVWFHLLTATDHKHYEVLYKHQRAADHLVTRYAATDVEEGYAEAFSFYVIEAPILAHRDALSYQYLAHWRVPAQ